MRTAPIVLLLFLSGCAGAEPHIVSQTPASIEIECIGGWTSTSCRSAQAVADLAQSHCRQYGLDALESKVAVAPSGNRWAVYACVNTQSSSAPPAALRPALAPR
jgi:hypothetical protein